MPLKFRGGRRRIVEEGRDRHSNFAGKDGERGGEISAARLRPCLRPYAAAADTTHNALSGAGGRGRDVLISFLGDATAAQPRPPLTGCPKERPEWNSRRMCRQHF